MTLGTVKEKDVKVSAHYYTFRKINLGISGEGIQIVNEGNGFGHRPTFYLTKKDLIDMLSLLNS